jgi:hypothetical protein
MAKKVLRSNPPVMKRLLLASALCLATLIHISAQTSLQPSTAAMKSALTKVISAQMTAFRANDFPKAYTFAADGVRKLFPLPLFEKMVRTNYPVLLEKVSPSFGITLDDGQRGVVFLELDGVQGPEVFRYLLLLESGVWKIGAVEKTEQKPPQKAPLTA